MVDTLIVDGSYGMGGGVGLYRKTGEDSQMRTKRTVAPTLAIESALACLC